MIKKTIFSFLTLMTVLFAGLVAGSSAAASEPTFLKAQEAYRYEVVANSRDVAVTYHVQDGYYLYGKRFDFGSDNAAITLGTAEFPPGLPHSDEYFGVQEIYRGTFTAHVPYQRLDTTVTHFNLKLRLQGCADAGLCYPPQNWTAAIALPPVPSAAPSKAGDAAPPVGLLNKLVSKPTSTTAPVEFLPADQAFRPSAQRQDDAVIIRIAIADGYYLYRDRFRFSTAAPSTLGAPHWPAGEIHHDDYFGDQTVFRGELEVRVPFSGTPPARVTVTYQGCADAGLCYTPQTHTLDLGAVSAARADHGDNTSNSAGAEQDRLATLVRSGHWLGVLGAFWFFGLLLAFTPCVLPMVPILAGIIAGDGPLVSNRRAFALAVAYVGGMASTYTIVGVAFAAAGAQTQAVFQQPWILGLFAALFVALACAMFGFYELALPASLQTRFAAASGQLKGGRFVSTAIMGALSSLIVTACVAPPLVATFVVIGQAGAIGRGALALGSLSLGMGTPLLIVGASAGRLLPKSGPWMETVKSLFGVVFLGVAVWMLDRILNAHLTMVAWAAVPASAAIVLARVGRKAGVRSRIRAGAAALAGLYALLLLASAGSGGIDPLRPLAGTRWGTAVRQPLPFRQVKTSADLDRALAEANAAGQPTLLDFSADWCVSCKEMDAHTFNNPQVQAALSHYVVLRADVTANDGEDQALLQRFGIFGPPTTAFFKSDRSERRPFRLVGFVDADHFLQHLSNFEATP